MLSACSDNNTAEPPADASAETSTAVEEAPAAAPEASEPLTSEPQTSGPDAAEAPETMAAEPAEAVEPPTPDEPEVLAADAGAKLYESNCKVCHEAGLAKGIDTLHMHSAQGFNKMPAQATDKVSEAEVYAAVDYMVAAVS